MTKISTPFSVFSCYLLILIFFITGCNKLPVAEFSTNQQEYSAGDKVTLTNKSEHGKSYIWTLPDGTTRKEENVTFTTNSSMIGYPLIKLEAFSKNGTKSNYAVKGITVKAATGKLVLYDGQSYKESVIVYVDGLYHAAVIFPAGSTVPTCDQAGYPTITLTEGPHIIKVSGQSIWEKTVIINKNKCTVTSYR
jgi:PKD repeat protein